MKRRVVQHGPSTLTISLPAKWAKERGLTKGDEVSITEVDNGLLVSTEKGVKYTPKELEVHNINNILPQIVAALYKKGHDELVFHYANPKQLEDIHEILNKGCIGFEIVEENEGSVTIKTVSEPSQEEFRILFRRMFYFLLSVADDGLQAAQKHNTDLFKKLVLRDQNINKLADFCRRVVNKRNQSEYSSDTALYHAIEQLEKIGDHYGAINYNLARSNTKLAKQTLTFYGEVNAMLRQYEKIFFDFDLQRMDEFILECKKALYGRENDDAKNLKDFFVVTRLDNIVMELHNLMGTTLVLHL